MTAARSSVTARRRRSMARRLATVISHAPGLRGTPSTCQRSSALTNASCSASSARAKSPSRLMRAARIRPCSSRKVASIDAASVILYLPLLPVPCGPDFNRAVFCAGELCCPGKCFVKVFAVHQEKTAELLVRFSKGAVGGQRFALPDAHRRRSAHGSEAVIRDQHPGG